MYHVLGNILSHRVSSCSVQDVSSAREHPILRSVIMLLFIRRVSYSTIGMFLILYVHLKPRDTRGQARRGGTEVAGWTLDRKIRVRFPAYPHRVWAFWWQGGKRRLRTSRYPCRGRLGTLKTPSCPWRGCSEAGQNLETGHLSRHYIAEISLNVTLNHNQHQHQQHKGSMSLTWVQWALS